MLSPFTYFEETGSVLGISIQLPDDEDTIKLALPREQTANLDLSGWPLVVLFQPLAAPVPEDAWPFYLNLLSINSDLGEATLAYSEVNRLHLIQSFDTSIHAPSELASALMTFVATATSLPARLTRSADVPSTISVVESALSPALLDHPSGDLTDLRLIA